VKWDSPLVLAFAGTMAIHVILVTTADAVEQYSRTHPEPAPEIELFDVDDTASATTAAEDGRSEAATGAAGCRAGQNRAPVRTAQLLPNDPTLSPNDAVGRR
jgi:hypothetical protein